MDLRRERKKQNRLLGFAITISAVCFAAAAAFMIIVFSKPEIKNDYIGGLDSRAETVALGLEGISGVLNSKDDFSFEWLKKFLQADPQQSIDIYYLCAFAGFNSQNYEACEKILNYILLLDENNHVAKYYLKQLKTFLS